MAAFVLDTSIALKWFLQDETDREYSVAVLRSITDENLPAVPWLWYYEIANTILTQVRHKRIMFDDAVDYLNIIDEMTIEIDAPDAATILGLPHLARLHDLTVYDAAFLELAVRLKVPLATSDQALLRAAANVSLPVLKL